MSQDHHRHSHSSNNDAGNATPIRLFLASALGWLMISSILGLIVSLKLHLHSCRAVNGLPTAV